ncbi:MAG: hypothetical protein CMB72_05800 [Euryarchaeota archaeon]|nr:hypothetical protein [Euryarchaeota archaeon]
MDIMARGRVLSILIVILLMPVFSLTISASSGSMISAGSGGVAIVGLPAHEGDNLIFSSLIHNEGEDSGSVRLSLSIPDGESIVGDEVFIEPGSSREVQAIFTLPFSGQINVTWEIISSNSIVSENLSGISSISVDEPQNLDVEIIDSSWTLADGLDLSFRSILEEGRERQVSIEVSGISGSDNVLLQRFDAILSPGMRHFTLSLGSPEISSLLVTITPFEWISDSVASDQIDVSMPIISGSIEILSLSPEAPTSGDSVSVEVQITNTGTDPIGAGRIRLISLSTGIVLEEKSTSSIPNFSESIETLMIQSWPEGNPVDLRAEWISNEMVSEFEISVISNIIVTTSDTEIPWITLIVGAVSGILVAIALRSANKGRKSSVGRNLKKNIAPVKKNVEEPEKREVNCPECNRALLVPYSYSGRARCAPPCSTEFSVSMEVTEDENPMEEDNDLEEIEDEQIESEEDTLIARSNDDLLDCPSCNQVLKVPLSKRPATARCPACKIEFKALEGV